MKKILQQTKRAMGGEKRDCYEDRATSVLACLDCVSPKLAKCCSQVRRFIHAKHV